MNILVIGDESNLSECRQKFGADHQYLQPGSTGPGVDVVFDFVGDTNQVRHFSKGELPHFFDASRMCLEEINQVLKIPSSVLRFGFAGLPTFLNRQVLEVSLFKTHERDQLTTVCDRLGTAFQVVEDKVGLVTPRVICMIINEAYFTVQEGTATREDIDIAMKLGTAYPVGPFEWCKKIGVRNVRDLLEAVNRATGDERYKVCELLREEAE